MSSRDELMRAEEIFQCSGCSQTIVAEPPDENHTKPSRKKSDSKEAVAVDYRCVSCGQSNTIYWYTPEA